MESETINTIHESSGKIDIEKIGEHQAIDQVKIEEKGSCKIRTVIGDIYEKYYRPNATSILLFSFIIFDLIDIISDSLFWMSVRFNDEINQTTRDAVLGFAVVGSFLFLCGAISLIISIYSNSISTSDQHQLFSFIDGLIAFYEDFPQLILLVVIRKESGDKSINSFALFSFWASNLSMCWKMFSFTQTDFFTGGILAAWSIISKSFISAFSDVLTRFNIGEISMIKFLKKYWRVLFGILASLAYGLIIAFLFYFI